MKISLTVNSVLFFILMAAGNSCFAESHSYFSSKFDQAIDTIVDAFLSFSNEKNAIKGNGELVTKKYDFTAEPFDSVIATGNSKVDIYVVSKPDAATVLITTDSNLIQYLDIYVNGKTLYLSKKGNKDIGSTKREIVVNTGELKSLTTSGACNAAIHEIKADVFHAKSSGASKIDLHGNTILLSIVASGASAISTASLESNEVDVSCSGASTVLTQVKQRLNVEAAGTCKVKYMGDPEEIKEFTRGLGRIMHAEF